MEKKKVAIVCGALTIGGAENMICELVHNLDKNKFDLRLYCLGLPCHTFLEKKVRKSGVKIVFCGISGRVTVKKLYHFTRQISEFKPDVIHTHISGTIYSLPYILTHPVRHIHTLHTAPELEFSKIIRKILAHRYKSGKSILVTVSKENQELAQRAYGLSDKEVKYINNGVEVNKYYRKKHNNFTYINVGRQDVNKNQKIIIDAFYKLFKQYPDIRLILVGDGNQHDNLVERTKTYNLQNYVSFPGLVNNVEDYLAVADVYIQSSHTEGLPLSVIEAMAASLPIISTDVGGMPDIIRDNGILIGDNSIDELQIAMKKILCESVTRKSMEQKSKELAETYSSNSMANLYGCLYDCE